MVRISKGDSVFVLLRFPDDGVDEEAAVEIHAVYTSEDAAGCYLDALADKGVDTDNFEIIERALDLDPSNEE